MDIVRVMKMCMSFIASRAGCLGDLHCTGIGRCFCSFSQRLSVYHLSLIYPHKRPSYVSGLTMGPGNARAFLANSTIHRIFILIALARSRCTVGPAVALRSLGTLHSVYL